MDRSFWNFFFETAAGRGVPLDIVCATGFGALEKSLQVLWTQELRSELSEIATYAACALNDSDEWKRVCFVLENKTASAHIKKSLKELLSLDERAQPSMPAIVAALCLARAGRWSDPLFMRWLRTLWSCAELRNACFSAQGLSGSRSVRAIELISLARSQGALYSFVFAEQSKTLDKAA